MVADLAKAVVDAKEDEDLLARDAQQKRPGKHHPEAPEHSPTAPEAGGGAAVDGEDAGQDEQHATDVEDEPDEHGRQHRLEAQEAHKE